MEPDSNFFIYQLPSSQVKRLFVFLFVFSKDSCKAPGKGECSVGRRKGNLTVSIRPVNDRPTLHLARGKSFVYFPPVPENSSDIDGKCIDVSVLTRTSQVVVDIYIRRRRGKELFERMAAGEVLRNRETMPLVVDPDNREPGLAITEAPNTKFGVWKFKRSGDGVLREIRVNAGRVLLLKPRDCIIFQPTGGESFGLISSLGEGLVRVNTYVSMPDICTYRLKVPKLV